MLFSKWKMPKKVIGGLVIAVLFEVFSAAIGVQAQTGQQITEQTPIVLSNGAVLTKLEAELLAKDLVILEKITILDVNDEGIASSRPVVEEPLNVSATLYDASARYVSAGVRTMTAYNSEPGQTDDSPCITANGFNVCEHGLEDTVAANFLKFGTKVRIPDLFGDRIFVVRDRMNQRYPDRVDVWMVHKSDAKQFGVRRAEIEVLVD